MYFIKSKILLLALLVFAVGAFAVDFDFIGSGASNGTKTGGTIEDTVTGANITGAGFSFVSKQLSGSREISVKIIDPGGPNTLAQSGLMIREGLDPLAPYVCAYVNGSNKLLRISARYYQGSGTAIVFQKVIRKASKFWLKIEKVGQRCEIYIKYKNNWPYEYLDAVYYMPAGPYRAGIASASGVGVSNETFIYKQFKTPAIAARISPASSVTAEIKVYPNPTPDRINLDLPIAPLRVRIFNPEGKVILDDQEPGRTNSYDLSSLPAGAYFIRADGLDNKLYMRIVKIE
jgi:hypothetical protein